MVGISNLSNFIGDNLKRCEVKVNDAYCFFRLSGLKIEDFMEIVNYKAWTYKSYQRAYNVRYVNIVNKLEKGATTLRTSVGFAPLLIRFLRTKGFNASGEDFRAREATFPAMQLSLYDFQERMVADWLRSGGIGVIKAPTGSGKCCKGNTLILTDKGLIKIEDIVRGISDSKNKDVSQTSLYDSFGEYGEKFIDNDNIKNLDKVISVSSRLKCDKYNISKKYDMGMNDTTTLTTSIGFEISGTGEHKIIVINKDGNLVFKKLEEISTDDHVAISYNTNIFNDRLRLNYYYRISSKNIKNILQNIEYMDDDIASLLGYAVAEGYDFLSEDKAIGHLSITNYDEELVDNTIRICKNLGISAERSYYQGKLTGVNISSVEIVDFIHYLGYRHGAKNKEVPWSILQADKRSQIAFIKVLFDCDGTVYQGETDKDSEKTKELVEYYSSSYELCRQLQILLINMGIISRLSVKKGATNEYRGELRTYEESYRLSVTGGEILKFSEIISFGLSRKKEILDKCVSALNSRSRWTDITYPNMYKKLNVLYERLKLLGKKGNIVRTWEEDFVVGNETIKITRKKKMSSYEYLKYNAFEKPMWAYITGERSPSKETLEKILTILEPTRDMPEYQYLKLLSKRFIFDNVESIKRDRDNVYDITIDNVHSYIGNGIINHNTIIGSKAIEEIGRKSLILVHTSDLLVNVWIDSLIKSFGPGITYQVGIVGGGVTDKDRITMRIGTRTSGFDENMRKDIVIATFQTLVNHLDELYDYKFGLMIVDECHHAPAQMFRKVNSVIKAPYKLGLSATVRRLDGMEKDIFGALGDIQSQVSIRELINKGILAEPRFQSPVIVDQEVMAAIETCGLGGLNLSRFVKKTSAASQKKLDYIINICKNIAARGRTFLLFTDYVRAEDVFVRDMYAERLIQEGLSISIVDQGMSSDERSKVFNYLETGKISGIIFGKLGSEGVNIPSVNVVVMANGIKSPITFCQRVGRVMRKVEGKDFCDVYEVLIDIPMEHRWSDFNFAEYRAEGFQKTVYKVD